MNRPMFDEMNASPGSVRPHYEAYQRWLTKQPADAMQARRAEAEMIFRRVGITFAVYSTSGESLPSRSISQSAARLASASSENLATVSRTPLRASLSALSKIGAGSPANSSAGQAMTGACLPFMVLQER